MAHIATLASAAVVTAAGMLSLTGPAAGQGIIGGYQAYIGRDDLTNSRGAALTQPWQVIRQDRANVHRFAISQFGDERDPWFGSGDMRSALESWVRAGGMDAGTRAAIMAGGVSIYVEILGQGSRPSGAQVRLMGAAGGGDFGAANAGATNNGGAGSSVAGPEQNDLIISPE